MRNKTAWSVIGRGKAGWHAKAADEYSTSSSGGDLKGYLADAADGALVYDADEAEYGAYVDLVFAGPMCDPNLGEYECRRFGAQDRETLARMSPGLGGGFLAVAALEKVGLCSLDYVGVGAYRDLLRAVPGVKVGSVKAGEVCWE
jgi:hypothetical protein